MTLKTIAVVLTADSSSLRTQLIAAARQVEAFHKSLAGAGRSAATSSAAMAAAAKGGAVALAVALASSVRAATQFEAAMRNVNSISGLSEQAFRAQGQAVVDLSRRLPQSAKVLAEGLYDIASSGFQGAEGLEILEKSAVAASAGLTTTQNAAKAITAVLNAYGKEASEAGAVSDVLFQTVNLGVVNFEELTGVIGDSVGSAAAAGVSIEELGAAVATMTLSGVSAAEAGTSMNRVMTELIKPGDELKAVLKSLGYESGIAAIQQLGLHGTMELLRTTTGGTAEAVVALFREQRAARGAFALMADEGQKYAEVTEGIGHASDGAGAAQKALNEQMKGLGAQWKLFVNDINAAAIAGGNQLLPFLSDLLKGARELGSDALPALREGMAALAPFFDNIAEIGGDVGDIAGDLVDALGPLAALLAGLAVGGVIESLNALSSILADITGLLADNETVVTAAVLALGGLAAAGKAATVLVALPRIFDAIALGAARAALGAGNLAAGLTTAAGAAKAFGAASGLIVLTSAITNLNSAADAAKRLRDQLLSDVDMSSLESIRQGLADLGEESRKANDKIDKGLFEDTFKTVLDALPLVDTGFAKNVEKSVEMDKAWRDLSKAAHNFSDNLKSVAEVTGLSTREVEDLARTLGVDLTKAFDDSGPARQKIIDHANEAAAKLKQVKTNAYGAGRGLSSGIGRSVDDIKAASDAVDALADATAKAFSSSVDLIGGYAKAQADHTQALDDLASAQERAASATDGIASAQERAADSAQRVIDAQENAAEAAERVTDAQRKVVDAETHLSELRIDLAERAAEAQEDYAEKVEEANERVLESQETLRDAQERVVEAEQRVVEMRTDFAERAAEAQERYAERVEESNDNILRAEEDLADRRISLAQDVADAQRRLEEDRLEGQERINAAEQRVRDVQKRSADDARERQQRDADRRRLDAASSPEERRRIQAQIDARKAREEENEARERAAKDLREAQENLAKARKDAAETEKKNTEALAEARKNQAEGLVEAEEKVAKARAEGLKVQKEGRELARQQAEDEKAIAAAIKDVEKAREGVVKAEEGVAHARRESVKVQKEGAELAKQQARDEKAIAEAVEAVEDARRGVGDAQKDAAKAAADIARAQRDAAKAGEEVGRAQSDAAKAYDDVAKAQQRVNDTSLEGFFAKTIRDAKVFAEGIREAARQGLNPALIAQLLQEGPEKAAPILRGIMADQTGTLTRMLNETSATTRQVQEQLIEAARVTQRAINATGTDMARDFGTAMDILAVKAAEGGQATADKIAEKLGIGVEKVRQIVKDYVIVLADGINPLLEGIGSPPVQLDQVEGGRVSGISKYAGGGRVPGVGDTDSVPAMLTPGEYVFSKPAVERIGFRELEGLHQQARRGYAKGGFVYPNDVPVPPGEVDDWGTMVGYAGAMANQEVYYAVREFLAKHPPNPASGGSGNAYGYQALIDFLNLKGVDHQVSSTVREGAITSSGNVSLHSAGLAADFVSANMREIFDTFKTITPSLQELFYDPAGHSVKRGQVVDWTVGGHDDHVHAATWGSASEGPGVPTGKGGGSAASGSLDDWIREGLAIAGKPASWHEGIRARAMQESGGDPNALNDWDSNAAAGTPSKGVMQVIDPTFEAYKVPGYDDIWNPVHNIAAAANYIESRYGDPYSLPKGGYRHGGLVGTDDMLAVALKSYDQGGWLPPGISMAYNGTGRPEAVGGAAIDYDRLIRGIGDQLLAALRSLPQPVIQVAEKRLGEVAAAALERHRGGRL